MTSFLITAVVVSILILTYLFIFRPRQLRWGATGEEVACHLPGDNIVEKPDFNATRGITIHATPGNIWKWIIQIGSNRGGWYSIDWIDNGGQKSTEMILLQFQTIEPGQFIPFTPDQKNGMWVRDFRENEYLLWADKESQATWLWQIVPVGPDATRLITRLRTKYSWKGIWMIYYILFDMGDIVMMRKCLKGIKKRAENLQNES